MLSRSSAASGPACKVGQHSQRTTTVSTAALLHRCCTPSEREWRGKGGGPEDRGVAPAPSECVLAIGAHQCTRGALLSHHGCVHVCLRAHAHEGVRPWRPRAHAHCILGGGQRGSGPPSQDCSTNSVALLHLLRMKGKDAFTHPHRQHGPPTLMPGSHTFSLPLHCTPWPCPGQLLTHPKPPSSTLGPPASACTHALLTEPPPL